MQTRPFKLGPAQIAEASRLREVMLLPWTAIAKHFGVEVKTVRRHCDPSFNRASNGAYERLGTREAEEEHRRRQYGDLLFKQRVLQIRREGASEARHFRLGVRTDSGTAHPKLANTRGFVPSCSPIADA
jgi:hypothetical protein